MHDRTEICRCRSRFIAYPTPNCVDMFHVKPESRKEWPVHAAMTASEAGIATLARAAHGAGGKEERGSEW